MRRKSKSSFIFGTSTIAVSTNKEQFYGPPLDAVPVVEKMDVGRKATCDDPPA